MRVSIKIEIDAWEKSAEFTQEVPEFRSATGVVVNAPGIAHAIESVTSDAYKWLAKNQKEQQG